MKDIFLLLKKCNQIDLQFYQFLLLKDVHHSLEDCEILQELFLVVDNKDYINYEPLLDILR